MQERPMKMLAVALLAATAFFTTITESSAKPYADTLFEQIAKTGA